MFAMHGKDVLCQIDSYGYDSDDFPSHSKLMKRFTSPSWHLVAVKRVLTGRGLLGTGKSLSFVRPFMKVAIATAALVASMLALGQVVPLEKPEFMACRDRPASLEVKERCLRGPEAIADFRKVDAEVVERILLVQPNSTEDETKALFGAVPRLVKPTVRARLDGTQYISKSMSWWVLPESNRTEMQRFIEGGTLEVQFVNGLVASVWWHRVDGFLNVSLSGSPCVFACPDNRKQGDK